MSDDIYVWWPVRLGWKRRSALQFLDWHGWQVGSFVPSGQLFGRRVFGQTFHIGPLKIKLGPSID